jgi:UDPglucose 6-dehydrogenase
MDITVVGTGYVGLVSGTCFAAMGNNVTCVDVDSDKIAALNKGEIPIYEPGLQTMVQTNLEEGRLHFSVSLPQALELSQVVFIAVGTPEGEDGSADLQHVLQVAVQIGQNLCAYKLIVNKSTVPVGTAEQVRSTIQHQLDQRGCDIEFDVVSNPEFLKEGAAIEDFMRPDRIIIGCDNERAASTMRTLYAQFNRNHERTIFVGIRDAELIKYTANAMLATKISFMNEIANLCEYLNVDVENVRRGIGSDSRIGFSFIYPGCGYGGSCFPKDVAALAHMALQHGYQPLVLDAVRERNCRQRQRLYEKLWERYGEKLAQMDIALWGLAFKPGTDDLREAPARYLLEKLIQAGARIKAYDPAAMEQARKQFPAAWFANGQLQLVDEQYEALKDADCLVLVTEWKPFRTPDLARMHALMRHRVVYDGRNIFDSAQLCAQGFEYYGIGR